MKLDGPGKLAKALKINRKMNTKPANKKTGLWIEDKREKILSYKIKKIPRIGIHYAERWVDKPLRFILEQD